MNFIFFARKKSILCFISAVSAQAAINLILVFHFRFFLFLV